MEIKLTSSQKQKIKKIGQKYGLVFAVVFGSVIKDQRGPESDLDIAVLTKEEPSYQLFKNLFSDFSEVFKGENVDIRFLNGADPLFRYQVIKNGQLLFGGQSEFNQFKAYAFRSYHDDGRKYFPYLEKLLEENQKKLEARL